METVTPLCLELTVQEVTVLRELLESAQARLLVEIRHAAHRSYRGELRHRLDLVDHLLEEIPIP
jgi:hypothetical protein